MTDCVARVRLYLTVLALNTFAPFAHLLLTFCPALHCLKVPCFTQLRLLAFSLID